MSAVHLGLAMLLPRWTAMGIHLPVSKVIVRMASPRTTAMDIPAGRVCLIVVDTLPRCVSEPWRGNTFPMVGAIMVLVMGVMVVMALLS